MKRIQSLIIVLLLSFQAACQSLFPIDRISPPLIPSNEENALNVMKEFFSLLNRANYQDAAQFYGGTYENMIENNPNLDPKNKIGLLRNACEINGIQCLEVLTTRFDQQTPQDEFFFQVEFQAADGGLFVLGPCCGASEEDQPPRSIFDIRVIKTDEGNFLVLDMPPYVP